MTLCKKAYALKEQSAGDLHHKKSKAIPNWNSKVEQINLNVKVE
jgi:hypothetical protein